MSAFHLLRKPSFLWALTPLAIAAAVWWQEAIWFKPPLAAAALQIVLFNLLVAAAIYPVSLLALGRMKARTRLVLLALLLSAGAVLIARQAVIGFIGWGYSQELGAYTSAVAAAASKRGLVFVLCAASLPLALSGLLILQRHRPASKL
jgi:hypothetical protein